MRGYGHAKGGEQGSGEVRACARPEGRVEDGILFDHVPGASGALSTAADRWAGERGGWLGMVIFEGDVELVIVGVSIFQKWDFAVERRGILVCMVSLPPLLFYIFTPKTEKQTFFSFLPGYTRKV